MIFVVDYLSPTCIPCP